MGARLATYCVVESLDVIGTSLAHHNFRDMRGLARLPAPQSRTSTAVPDQEASTGFPVTNRRGDTFAVTVKNNAVSKKPERSQ